MMRPMRYRRTKGFTLVELMITLLVAAVVLGIGVPNFQEFIANNRMAAATNDLISVLHLARGEAVKRRANVTICPSADWDNFGVSSCTAGGRLADGWILFVDCSAAAPCGPPNIQVDAFDLVGAGSTDAPGERGHAVLGVHQGGESGPSADHAARRGSLLAGFL